MPPIVKDLGELTGALLVFGGPYSNLQATEALFAKAEQLNIPATNIICTGDVVAYCGDPGGTTDLIQKSGIHVIKGNVEISLAEGAGDCGCGFEEDSACDLLSVQWFNQAVKEVSADQIEWKAALPDSLQFNFAGQRFEVVHGARTEVSRFVFASQDHAPLLEDMANRAVDVTLAGHNGIPYTKCLGSKVWHNAGVIGMPANEGQPHCWFSLIKEQSDGSIEFSHHKLSYDFNTAAATMRKKGYPEPYAQALSNGLWPSLDVLPEVEKLMTGRPLSDQVRSQLLLPLQQKAA